MGTDCAPLESSLNSPLTKLILTSFSDSELSTPKIYYNMSMYRYSHTKVIVRVYSIYKHMQLNE